MDIRRGVCALLGSISRGSMSLRRGADDTNTYAVVESENEYKTLSDIGMLHEDSVLYIAPHTLHKTRQQGKPRMPQDSKILRFRSPHVRVEQTTCKIYFLRGNRLFNASFK